MKILHVIPSMDPASGGPPMIAARFAAAQSILGCDMQITAYEFPKAQARIIAALKPIPHIDNVTLQYLPPLTKAERYFALGARRRFEPIFSQFDLIHLHGVWDPIIYAAAGVVRKLGKPYVITLHGMIEPWSLRQKGFKKKLALAFGYKRMLNQAAFLHCGTADERRLTENLDLKSPTKVVPNGIFLEEINPLPEKGEFRAQYPKLANAKLILFLSRLHYQKGLDFLADAFAIVSNEFPDAHLIVAGPDGGALADFQSQVARFGITSRVHVVGPIYGPQKLAAFRDCDCFCLPSRHEGFSIAVVEALACEAPTVITPGCHFPEVRETGSGIIADLNAPSIAQCIITMLRDPAAAQKMGQTARNLIITKYTWPQLAQQLIAGYREVLGKSEI